MTDFDKLNIEQKTIIKDLFTNTANSIGGKNFFLTMIENIRNTKPNPVLAKNCEFKFDNGYIKWNKKIFINNFDLLSARAKEESLLVAEKEKNYKNILNMVKALSPIEFKVTPKNKKDGDGFLFKCFEENDGVWKINILFEAIFLRHGDFSKKIF